jgi:hypothetical protein
MLFGDGCGEEQPGITFNASLSVQGITNFISSMSDAKIMFIQLANPYAIGHFTDEGYLCTTIRNPAGNFDSGWFRDGFEPYYNFNFFNPNGTATLNATDGPYISIRDMNYLYNERFYEMYLVYATGSEKQPRFSKPIAKIPWSWGGEVLFTSTGTTGTYTRLPVTEITHTGTAANSMRPYNHNYTQVTWGTCPPNSGNSPPDSNIYVEGVGWGWP